MSKKKKTKQIYLLPNLVTTGNLFCGFYSIIASVHYEFIVASWAIIAATVFDLLDGRIARLAKATSKFGGEYDSLSDLVSFGLAPALLIYLWAIESFGRLGWLASFLFVACGAFRLARFNVQSEGEPKGFFLGLPIPMAAGAISTFCIYRFHTGFPDVPYFRAITLVLAIGLGILMVSTILFPSFKEIHWRSKASFGYLFLAVVAIVLIAIRPEIFIFILLSAYLGLSLLWNILRFFKINLGKSSSGALNK